MASSTRRVREELEHVRRSRHLFNIAASLFLTAGIALTVWCVSQIIPWWGAWKYENRTETLALPEMSGPTFLEITIQYTGQPPENCRITDGEISVGGVLVQDSPEQKILTVTADMDADQVKPDMELSLRPMDNPELIYDITAEPSYRYTSKNVEFYSDENSDRWAAVWLRCGHLRENGELRISVSLDSLSGQPAIYESSTLADTANLYLNLSEILRRREIDLSDARAVSVVLTAEAMDRTGEPVDITNQYSQKLASWPVYDPEEAASRNFSMADTSRWLGIPEETAPDFSAVSADPWQIPREGGLVP